MADDFTPEVARIAKEPENKICFDCSTSDDVNCVATKLGIFICSECANLHRSLVVDTGVKCFVESRDVFTQEDIKILREYGNRIGRDRYLYQPPTYFPLPEEREFKAKKALRAWIECKYENRFFYTPKMQGELAYEKWRKERDITDALWMRIFSYLNASDVAQVARVNKRFCHLTKYLWKHTYLNDWNLRYPYRSTLSSDWKGWRNMYSKVLHTVAIVDSLQNRASSGVDLDIPVLVNDEPALVQELVQGRKYVNISTHGMTVKLVIHLVNLKKPKKLPVVDGLIFLFDCRNSSKNDLIDKISAYERLGLTCPSVMMGVMDNKVEEKLPISYIQSYAVEHGMGGFVPIGEIPREKFFTHSNEAKSKVSSSLAIKLATEVLVERLCMHGWPGLTLPPQWIPDNFSDNCMMCNKKFTAVNRRHHCRRCGYLCCSKCAKNKILVPFIKQFRGNKLLVCRRCEEACARSKDSFKHSKMDRADQMAKITGMTQSQWL